MHIAHQGLCTREVRCKRSQRRSQRLLLLIVLPEHVVFSTAQRSVLRDETCTSTNLPPPPANKECSEGAQAPGTGTRGPLKARPANDLHGLRCISTRTVSTPRRLASQTHVAACERSTSTYQLLISRSPFLHCIPHHRAGNGSREKQRQQLTTMGRTSVVVFLRALSWTTTRANMSCLRRRWCFQTRLEGSETLRRTHPPPPACRPLPG